jgi:phosphoglycerate kinase
MLKSVHDAPIGRGTRVLVRSNFNVPIVDGRIADEFRITESLSTLHFLRESGARTIAIGHVSAPNGTLKPVFEALSLHMKAVFVPDPFSLDGQAALSALAPGDVAVVENIRRQKGEEENDPEFAKKLASLGDIFVNDDFSSAHRMHASIVGVPEWLPCFMGLRFAQEYEMLSQAFSPAHPSVLILGGAKVETKLPVVATLADVMDSVFVCGVSGNTLVQAFGKAVGASAVGTVSQELCAGIQSRANVYTYSDVLVSDGTGEDRVVSVDAIGEDDSVVDAGPDTTANIVDAVSRAGFVLWNGPLGYYEKGYTTATHEVARALSRSKGQTILGGGDTRAAISALGLEYDIGFISTAGGAMLQFLADKTLPGIEALKKSA